MDRLVQAHNYFNKHNPTSLELTDVVRNTYLLKKSVFWVFNVDKLIYITVFWHLHKKL